MKYSTVPFRTKLPEGHPPQARKILRKPLDGKLTCMPVMVGESKEYQVAGQGNDHKSPAQ